MGSTSSWVRSNCRDSVGARECDAYGPCDILVDDVGEEILDASTIEGMLEGEGLGAIGAVYQEEDHRLYNLCKKRCMKRACCFEDVEAYSCYAMVRVHSSLWHGKCRGSHTWWQSNHNERLWLRTGANKEQYLLKVLEY